MSGSDGKIMAGKKKGWRVRGERDGGKTWHGHEQEDRGAVEGEGARRRFIKNWIKQKKNDKGERE